MKVYKFGGASVKDASSILNVTKILKSASTDGLILVVSAMGKITNELETLTEHYFHGEKSVSEVFGRVKKFHLDVAKELFDDTNPGAYDRINSLFSLLEIVLLSNPTSDYDQQYDEIVSYGELLSSAIISSFLEAKGFAILWKDARTFIKTDSCYREGKVDWELSSGLIRKTFSNEKQLYITQGFIGAGPENKTTTLGREGSDYTAAILAHCSNSDSLTIWKDVPGVLNADPKWFDQTVLIPYLSYQDAIELAYYGATVIHPKTIKPLQNKNIPLHVRSFLKPQEPGTLILNKPTPLPVPCFIFKINQVLISIFPKDFSFIAEENLSGIFHLFAGYKLKINSMQNSAISFTVCLDYNEQKIATLVAELQKEYRVRYNTGLELATIRNYDQATIDRVCNGKNVLLEVKSRNTVQLVLR